MDCPNIQNSWVFDVTDYRTLLTKKIELEGDARGYRTALARAAGCQLAYISHVLHDQAQFTPDHVAGLSEFWGFDDLETEYFLTLVHVARAATPRLTARLDGSFATTMTSKVFPG